MRGINRVMLAGHLGTKPELLVSKNGNEYTYLSLATHRQKKNGEGKEETTDWHSVTAWGNDARYCTTYLDKGDPIFIDGILTQYMKKDDNGQNIHMTSVSAQRVHGLNSKKKPAAN